MTLEDRALSYATEEASRALKNIMSLTQPEAIVRRLAERTIKAYLSELKSGLGPRMKPSTREIMALEPGESCLIQAFCKQNVHGQLKTIRRHCGDYSLKWRIVEESPGHWRVMRLPPGVEPRRKPPIFNPKARLLASIGLEPVLVREYRRPMDFMGCNTKARAREILGEPDADWTCASRPEGVLVWRKPLGVHNRPKRKLVKPRPVWDDRRLGQLEDMLENHIPVTKIARRFKTSRGSVYHQIAKLKESKNV